MGVLWDTFTVLAVVLTLSVSSSWAAEEPAQKQGNGGDGTNTHEDSTVPRADELAAQLSALRQRVQRIEEKRVSPWWVIMPISALLAAVLSYIVGGQRARKEWERTDREKKFARVHFGRLSEALRGYFEKSKEDVTRVQHTIEEVARWINAYFDRDPSGETPRETPGGVSALLGLYFTENEVGKLKMSTCEPVFPTSGKCYTRELETTFVEHQRKIQAMNRDLQNLVLLFEPVTKGHISSEALENLQKETKRVDESVVTASRELHSLIRQMEEQLDNIARLLRDC